MTVPPPEEAETRILRGYCDPEQIGYLNAILDAYEGLVVLRTVDPHAGKLEFWAQPQAIPTLRIILSDLAPRVTLNLEENDAPGTTNPDRG